MTAVLPSLRAPFHASESYLQYARELCEYHLAGTRRVKLCMGNKKLYGVSQKDFFFSSEREIRSAIHQKQNEIIKENGRGGGVVSP